MEGKGRDGFLQKKTAMPLRYLLLWLLLGCAAACVPADTAPQPNILLILVDDLGYGDLSLTGNPHLSTPHLDQLGKESAQFRHFYVSPVCAPTRASLLTGRYHHRAGVRSVTNGFETMVPDEETLAELLAAQGYRTGIFGKWHLGEYYPSLPQAQGFDTFVGFRTGHTDVYEDAVLEKNGAPYPTRGHITRALTDEALAFMAAPGPFFCYLAYNAPHTPLIIDTVNPLWRRGWTNARPGSMPSSPNSTPRSGVCSRPSTGRRRP
ncbi:MAG: hypothetical protein OHK0039_09140 [Bacteroidia bacterium]